MTSFAILLGGDLTVTSRLRSQIAGARVIAADSGMMHAASLGLLPEFWVGDFDSAGSELTMQYREVPRQIFPAEKDTTDGGLAIAAALERGGRSIVLVGGLGGQADHMLGHMGQVLQLAQSGIASFATSGHEEARPLLPGRLALDLPPGSRLSIVPFANLHGLDLEGVKWPLAKRSVPLGSTLTLSNVAQGPVRIGLGKGMAMILAYPVPADV